MKTCPNCLQAVTRRKKGCCPNCGQELVLVQKMYMLKSEKEAAYTLIAKLEKLIQQRDGIVLDLRTDKIELKFAYDYVIRARKFLNNQQRRYGYDVNRFLSELFDFIIKNKWWYENLKSLRMLSRQINSQVQSFWKESSQVAQEIQRNVNRIKDLQDGGRLEFVTI